MEIEHRHVNAGITLKAIDVGKEGVKKIVADAFILSGIEDAPAV